jgi:hypothetical protein
MKMKTLQYKFSLSMPWKHVEGVEVWLHLCLTSTLDGDGWLATRRGRFAARKERQCKLRRRLSGAQIMCGPNGEQKNFLTQSGMASRIIRTPAPSPQSQPPAPAKTLHRLRFSGSNETKSYANIDKRGYTEHLIRSNESLCSRTKILQTMPKTKQQKETEDK